MSNIENQPLMNKEMNSSTHFPSEASPPYYQPPSQQPLPNVQNHPTYQIGGIGVQPSYFHCEVEPQHSSISANKKCSFCNKIMCLKCTKSLNNYNFSYNSYFYSNHGQSLINRECCIPCGEQMDNVRIRWKTAVIINYLLFFIGSITFLFPLFIIGIIICAYCKKKIDKNNVYTKGIRYYFSYSLLLHVIMLIIYGISFTITVVCLAIFL